MKRTVLPYNPNLKQLARELRNKSTLSETLLWKELKGKQLRGYDFHRQKPINRYIVDFFCNELKLAIEIDGTSHNDKREQDIERQNVLEGMGITVLRFSDEDVKRDMLRVLATIEGWIERTRSRRCGMAIGNQPT